MPKLNINIPPLLKYSIQVYRKYASFVFGVMVTYFALGLLPEVYIYFFTPKNPTTESQIVSFIAAMVRLFLSLGFTKIMYYLIDDRAVKVNDLVNNGRIFLSYIVAYFLYFFAVLIGLFLLIIPGIYLAVRLQFYPYYIIKEEDTSFTALRKSWYVTEGFIYELVLFGASVLLLNFLGAVFLGIGLILTYPITSMATAIVFNELEAEAEQIPTSKYLP
ncbi:MAG TPA: hypothetical protein VE868_05690 [Balneolaceae bacterium]|nr:hypothetical protein [Balneolaceae bacterium]